MTENVTPFPTPPPQPDLLVGPFEEWRVIVDGRVIPNLTGTRQPDGLIWLYVDHRFGGGPFTEEQARQAAYLIAQGMAISAGYPHLGAATKDRPFAAIGMAIDGLPQK